jgi:RNA polymerase sigma factor (sigma-70 family)
MSEASEDSFELLERMRAGEPEAVEALMGRHLAGLRAYVRVQGGALLRAREESTDLVQSVCREVLTKLDRFQYGSEAGFKHWLYATALRKIRDRYDYYLAAKRDVRLENGPAATGSAASGAAGAPGELADVYRSVCTPSRAASANEEIARIEEAFDKLPEHYREVIVQARLLGLSRAEIGRQTGRTEGAVSVLLFRASARLAGLLDLPSGAG